MMVRRVPTLIAACATIVLAALLTAAAAAPLAPDLLSGLVWRNVGPFRGGRISAASGAIGEVGTFYVGLPAGGVWKTTSAGETWYPVFDAISSVSSVGALEVAPSNANVIYVGTGDEISGDGGNGMYKSVDAGKNWTHIGLESSSTITSIIVDPRNADVLLAAVQGSANAKGRERGVWRSTNGGSTWSQTLFVNDSMGFAKLAMAFDRPDVIYATSRRRLQSPRLPSGLAAPSTPPPPGTPTGTGLYKSTDGGVTWKELSGGGLPRWDSRTSIAVAMHTNARRVYLITNAGFYRSDDGGTTWRQMAADDSRIRNGQGGYNCGLFVDPADPEIVYTFSTASYKSTDGGATFTGFKGSPGGDDAQAAWIDPTNGKRILLGYDQGAIVSLDGGGTWSSWYNQSTEQVYHIATDNGFPYWIYATQQDAGAIRIRSRGDLGAITPLDWSPVNGWEWGTIVVDPRDKNIVYSSGYGITRIDMGTGQWISVSPEANSELRLRVSGSEPIAWAPWDPHELLAGFQDLRATTDGGAHWRALSPDLTYPAGVTPPPDTAIIAPDAPRRGSINTIAASRAAKGTIWVGTDNGLIKLTRDHGKTWADVTIPNLPYPARANSQIEASPFDAAVAYAAVYPSRPADSTPYLFRTRDHGGSWQLITKGLPSSVPSGTAVNVVRADPARPGLLFAGTESGMYVSFDDGDDWQSLQLNLPNTSFQDIAFAGNDLLVGTYGRGIWILDDYAVMRQMDPTIARETVHLFKPDPAVRVRRNVNWNTPLPPEVPHALNPPDGAIIYYWLASAPQGELTIDVTDSSGAPVRHLSSVAAAPVKEAARPPHTNFWVAPPEHLPAAAGTNRASWDIRYDAPPSVLHSFEINANPGLTPTSPVGALAPPGTYTIKLTVGGQSLVQTVRVTNDPRSRATAAGVRAQVLLQRRIEGAIRVSHDAYQQVAAMRVVLDSLKAPDSTSAAAKAIATFRARFDSIGGEASDLDGPFYDFSDGNKPATDIFSLHIKLVTEFMAQESADFAPTDAMMQGFAGTCRLLTSGVARWQALNATDLPALNAELAKAGLGRVPAAAGMRGPKC